jgi:hypothetical protein
LWEELGIGPRLREKMPPDGCEAPPDTALFAMTANRLARPASKLACDERWLADEVSGPEAKTLALDHRYRALDFLLGHSASMEPELCLRTADWLNADGELLFWETTTLYFESDDDDDAGEVWHDQAIPALRKRGHHKDGRDGNPPVVGGLALTRDGVPVRSWGFAGHTADGTTITHLKDDWRGWRLNRGVLGGESGMVSAAKRPRLSRALGRSFLAVPMRQVTEVPLEGLTRAGRSRDVAHNLRVQEVDGGTGARRRRAVVGYNPDAAKREQAPRERLLDVVRAELTALDTRPADHPKRACARLAACRFGRYLQMDARGRLRSNATPVAGEAT